MIGSLALHCKKPHIIFVGPNALHQAIWYDRTGREASVNTLYGFRPRLQTSMCWGEAKSASEVLGDNVVGPGVHAKIYTLQTGSILFSSQNNGASPLYEFAILYPRKTAGKLLPELIEKCFLAAKARCRIWGERKLWHPEQNTAGSTDSEAGKAPKVDSWLTGPSG
jgi:hypothetical protein